MFRKWVGMTLLAVAFSASGCSDDEETKGPTICPVDETCPLKGSERLSYKELSQRWWQWMVEIPASKSPVEDTTGAHCAENQPAKDVWFLAGAMAGAPLPTKRACKIPSGRGLFFPVLNAFCVACKKDEDCEARGVTAAECVEEPSTDQWLTECLEGVFPDFVSEVTASVDGTAVEDVTNYRVDGGVFSVTGLDDDAERPLICTKGTRKFSADGYYLFVEPLPAGKHTVAFSGKMTDGFELSVEYEIEVAAE